MTQSNELAVNETECGWRQTVMFFLKKAHFLFLPIVSAQRLFALDIITVKSIWERLKCHPATLLNILVHFL